MESIEVPDVNILGDTMRVGGKLYHLRMERRRKIECPFCLSEMFDWGMVGSAVDGIEYTTVKFGCPECGNFAYLTIGDSLDGQRYERFIEEHEEG